MEKILPLPIQVKGPKISISKMSTPIILQPSSLVSINIQDNMEPESVLLLDDQENLKIQSEEEFINRLNINAQQKVKVVSIFGNTGDGKSYTLNHAFFDGKEVFKTSPYQSSCTIGVWAKYDEANKMICLDTEGFLGITKYENQRTRLLLKILAISDIIIYRTRSERLQRDLYTFLGGASKAYKLEFSPVLEKMLKGYDVDHQATALGPSVIIFHETTNTETLDNYVDLQSPEFRKTPEEILRENFQKLNETCDGFSSIKYIGVKNGKGRSSFEKLRETVVKELKSTEVRSARYPKYIYLTLKALNEKYLRQINNVAPKLYFSAFFTCPDKCLACGGSCNLSMGHLEENEDHCNNDLCQLQHQFQNFVYYCRKCLRDGAKVKVEPCYQTKNDQFWTSIISTVWSGYKIECKKCGVIYQSREYWYGNKDPKDEAVEIHAVHVWPGQKSLLGSQNSAQRVLDGVTSITNVMATVGSQPTKMISDWMTDQIAPPYWRKNNEIQKCFKCETKLESVAAIHHCRDCGEGFCEGCSSKRKPVPWRGWMEDVRVCDKCFNKVSASERDIVDGNEVRTRRIGESVISSISAVKSFVVDKPKELIKDIARPTYWTPDSECEKCAVCGDTFGLLLPVHHCRDCGKGVCDKCSPDRKPVPIRGWDTPVRVCTNCAS